MKFKTIFLIFNIIIVVSFLFIFSMPLFLFGTMKFKTFFESNWIALAIFFLILIIFNTYFISNLKLFSLLEEENWLELITYLESRIYQKNIIQKNQVKILLNAYLVTSQNDATLRLQTHLEKIKPKLIPYFSVSLSIPYLLNNKPEKGELFFKRLLAEKKLKDELWIRWNYGLSLMQQNRIEEGRQELLTILAQTRDSVLSLLTIYILKSLSASDPDIKKLVEDKVKELTALYNERTWKKMLEEKKGNVLTLILSKIIDQASEWLFSPSENEGNREAVVTH